MPEIEERLEKCFALVFPKLRSTQIRTASTDDVDDWDSLASIRLAAVVEEEFGIKIPADDLPELMSFRDFEGYVSSR
ncbi:MAG TPA: acyl carrier protein [Acidobacteriaceae bacterium]|nr:acyl carrier protein [Acidobacteriaceae bacterium]